jgi:hypothetical protein
MSQEMVVPIADRRSRRRILTVKNIGGAALIVTVIFAAVSIRSEMRHSKGEGYGRLFGTQVPNQEIAKPKYDVVKENPVSDQTAADPTLLVPAARAQTLGIGIDPNNPSSTGTLVETATTTITPVTVDQASTPVLQGQSGVSIVGGTDGVTIVRNSDRQRPVLSGGIFKH